ncbi:gliding motility-associated C-terminal domain-containing protein [Chitinophaga sp. CF118]|uniref:Ig-like domain-containing protein n=1 Tax=Chitinophaga sp. CF118 TaxID=1884367 RepID=UPI0008E6BE8F|nr:Ig-like domain-containing protein [Chitinophaga sp. CF118]SFD61441.1 gliding motility-associated C-terminal domain-containing protein [Chitinophaga sp. CF118]
MKNTFTKLISKLLLILCFLFTGYQGFGQYTATTIATGGAYAAMAKDQSNNIYVVRYNATNDNYEVAKFVGGNPATSLVIYSGLSYGSTGFAYPWGITVNTNGDVFVVNGWETANNGEVIKLTYPSYSATTVQHGNYYSAITTDASDNLLTMEYNSTDNTYQVVKYTAGAESSAGTVVYNGLANPSSPLNPSVPWGLSVDSHNDIFFLGFLDTNGGSLFKLTYPSYNVLTTLGTNRSFTSLAIDANDNLYTSEGTSATTAQVVKYTYPVAVNATGTSLYTGLTIAAPTYPWGLAVNSSGQVFVNDGAASGSGRIVRLDPPTSMVSTITRLGTSPTAASSVNFAVIFNRAVTGVTASSFNLTTSGGITGASVSGYSGSGTTYIVSVNTGTGDGTLRLNVTGTGVVPTTTNVPYTSGPSYTIDRTKPVGSIVINSGSTITNNATVALTLAATDASSMQMRFSNDGSTWSTYEAFATSKSWALSVGDGLKTVYVQYMDAALNVQGYSSTITLDQTAPATTILTGPNDPTNSTNATFTFSSSEGGSTFQGSLDGAAYAGISSPATLSGIAEGAHEMSIRAIDPAGNIGTPVTYNWTVDLTAPIVTIVGVPANGYYVIGSPMNFVVNYAEDVVVNVTGGTPYLNVILNSGTVHANYVSGSGTSALTFTYVVVDGDTDMDGLSLGANIQTNGGTIKDPAGNTADVTLHNIGSLSGVFVNTIRPTVTLASSELPVLNHAIAATITFSEAVTGFTSGDIQATNATITAFTTSDNITYSITATPVTDGIVSLSVPASVALNVAGNPNSVSTNTLSFTYDITKPVVSSVSVPADGYYKAGDVLNFTVTFDGAVNLNTTGGSPYVTLTIGSSTVNATLSNTTASALTFSYTVVDGNQDVDGIAVNSLVLNGSTIKDAAGNNATLTLNNVASTTNVRVNTTHPSVTLSTPFNVVNAPFTTTIAFSEAVTGFVIGDISADNGATLSNLQTSDNTTFTVLVTPTAEGSIKLNVAADVAENIGHNGNTYASQLNVLYDITPPAVSSVSVPANGYYVAGNNMDFTVTFSEPIAMSFAGGTPYLNITIGSSVVQATYITGTTTSFTCRYTVVDGDHDMDGITIGSFDLNGHTLKDGAGNDAILTLNNVGNTSGVFVNTVHPSVVVSTTAPARVNVPYTATITFSEAVTGFTIGDIVTSNATLSNLQTSDNTFYTVLVSPVANGAVSVNVPATVAVNVGGNDNSASNTLSVTYDVTAPAITSVSVPANGFYKAGTTLSFTVNYDENVIVNTTGGTPYLNVVLTSGIVQAGYVSGSGTSAATFTYTVQPGDMDLNGPSLGANLQLNGGIIKDVATNDAAIVLQNVGSLTGVIVNTTAPVVTLVTVPANYYYKAGSNLAFTVQFSENILLNTTGGTPYINVTIGSTVVHAVYLNTAGLQALNFLYTVQNGDMDMDGITVGSLVANGAVIQDAATNDAVLTLNNIGNTTGVFVNTSHPTVALSTSAFAIVNAPFTATITFSEAVTGFTTGDIVVSNATLSNLQTSDNISYTVLVTPVTDGAVMMSIPPAVAVNIGNNDNTASPASLSLTYDATSPVITSVAVPANGYYKDGTTLSFVVNYNENVIVNTATGFPYLNVGLNTGGVEATYVSGSGTSALVFSYTVQPGDMDMDGITLISLVRNGGSIKDVATNNAVLTLNNVASTAGVLVNTATPQVYISTTAGVIVNVPFTVKLSFTEAVTGLTISGITASNATVSNLQTTDNVIYTALITPFADGVVNVNVPAGSAVNVVGNGNSGNNLLAIVYDATAPVINAGQTFNIAERNPVGTLVGKVTAFEARGTLQNWTITSDDSGGAFSIDNTGSIHVQDVTLLNNKANSTVTLTITVSDGLNTSIAETVTVNVKLVNQAPLLDVISDVVMCTNTDAHTIQLTGASAVEATQTYNFSIMANQPDFEVLSVDAAGLITYKLKGGVSGNKTVTVTIKDDGGTTNGGVDTLRRTFTITANSLPIISISSDKGNAISKGDIIHLTATGGSSYSWDNADGNISGEQSDILEAKPMSNTTYKVTVTSNAGCSDTAQITVKVVEDFKIDAVNILTPNGDGKNDKWVIRNLDSYPNNEVRIYDRTGRMVFNRRNYSNDWDGTMNGSPLAEGTYYYILTIDGGKTAKGYITIIRDRN